MGAVRVVSRNLVLAAWAALAAAGVGIEAASLATRRRIVGAMETLRALSWANAAFVVLFLAWMWLGWHVFAR
jgi:hypothetical protein